MRIGTTAILVVATACLVGPTTRADQTVLTGVARDFSDAHPDFENTYNSSFPLIQGMVDDQLGPDGKPVLLLRNSNEDDPLTNAIIHVTFYGTKVDITSTKDLSNVVLELTDGTEYKYDELDQQGVGQEETFEVPEEHEGEKIVGTWVKSGNNDSGDGPGYGEYIPEPAPDPQWRVESRNSFDEWFNNVPGVNESVPASIVLDNGQNKPGGVYRYERSTSNGQQFFPIDDELFGNEGRDHNYHFSYEINAEFTYTDPTTRDHDLVFHFSGDDDVWVYIDDELVVDLGGVHEEKYGYVNVDEVADELNLQPGEAYDFDFFFTERHTTESNLTIETTLRLRPDHYD